MGARFQRGRRRRGSVTGKSHRKYDGLSATPTMSSFFLTVATPVWQIGSLHAARQGRLLLTGRRTDANHSRRQVLSIMTA